MQVALFELLPTLMLLSHAFNHDVRFLWLFEGDQLHLGPFFLNGFGKQSLADLTLKFGEVVRNGDAIEIFLDFAVDPVFEAVHVHQFAAAFAGTRVDQWIGFGRLITKADLASAFKNLGCNFVDIFVELEMRSLFDHF